MEKQKLVGYALVVTALLLLSVLITVKHHTDGQETFLCLLVENDPDLSMDQCPAHNSSTSWLITTAFGLAFVMLGTGVFFLLSDRPVKHTNEHNRNFKSVDITKLDEEERLFYDFVRSAGGSAYQSDIIRHTDYSKVKTTRILDKLESKGVLERRRRGMTNIIVLR